MFARISQSGYTGLVCLEILADRRGSSSWVTCPYPMPSSGNTKPRQLFLGGRGVCLPWWSGARGRPHLPPGYHNPPSALTTCLWSAPHTRPLLITFLLNFYLPLSVQIKCSVRPNSYTYFQNLISRNDL